MWHLQHLYSHSLPPVQENGFHGPAFLTPDWNTAVSYSIMGKYGTTESIRGMKLRVPHPREPVVITLSVPRDFVINTGIYLHTPKILDNAAWREHKTRLYDQELYEIANVSDATYYNWTEIRFDEGIPPEFITAISWPFVK